MEGRLGKGFFNRVVALRGGWVLKLARPIGPFPQPLGWRLRNRAEHELARRYLRTPETYYLRMGDARGRPVNAILQRRIHGEPLASVPRAVLHSPELAPELERVAAALVRCRRECGWVPDVIGGPPRLRTHDIRRSNNLFLDAGGGIWLIDPGAMFFWFSRRNPLGRLYTAVLVRSALRLARRARGG